MAGSRPCLWTIERRMPDFGTYGGLFAAGFLAATLLPAQSEAVLAALVIAGKQPLLALFLVASVANVLGSVVNWIIGRGIERFRERRWFPASPEALAKAQATYRKWGHWSLLASWVPILGDPLTLMAGVMREPLWRFLALVTLAKAGRYLVVIGLAKTWL
jgi:membrane protein YqaA with SNARE-associated domain